MSVAARGSSSSTAFTGRGAAAPPASVPVAAGVVEAGPGSNSK